MPITASQQSDTESRFAHLLQPIRDLSKNWNIDIAGDLEEYLEEIEKISITFDGGASLMNFAEAAMVVQGSACIYSKKVEYLYSLVYQVLDLLACKKKQQQASLGAQGTDKDVTFKANDEEDAFLSMDDIGKGKDLYMKAENDSPEATIECLPRMPLVLIPVDTGEKKDRPLLSRTGEVLADCSDFKMNSSCLHISGCMLLDMSYLVHLQHSLDMMAASALSTKPAAPGLKEKQVMFDDQVEEHSMEVCAGPRDLPPDEGLPLHDATGGGDDYDGGFDPVPCDPTEAAPEQKTQMALRHSERARDAVQPFDKPVKPYVDPWKQELDPHEADSASNKPFKRSRTFRILAKLETQTNKKRKRGKQMEPVKSEPLSEFVAKAFVSQSKLPSNPLKAPSFPEFEDLYWKESKRRQMLRRISTVHQARFEEFAEAEEEMRQGDDQNDLPIPEDDYDDGDDDNEGAPFMFDMPEVPDNIGLTLNALDNPSSGGLNSLDEVAIPSSYEDLVRVLVDKFLASAQEFAQVTELSKKVTEWEDKIMPKLQLAEERGSFDIHRYEGNIIDSFAEEEEDPWVAFQRLAARRPQYEVSRLFLATLQLANNYNVQIRTHGAGDAAMDTMQIKLLSRKLHQEELAGFQAPSLV